MSQSEREARVEHHARLNLDFAYRTVERLSKVVAYFDELHAAKTLTRTERDDDGTAVFTGRLSAAEAAVIAERLHLAWNECMGAWTDANEDVLIEEGRVACVCRSEERVMQALRASGYRVEALQRGGE